VWNDQLWVGTMDWSYLAAHAANKIFDPSAPPLTTIGAGGDFELGPTNIFSFFNIIQGADLMFFQDSSTPAIPESLTGVGNATSYGVRNILPSSTADDSLFLGMANPMNLLTAPSLGPYQGGWELIQLSAIPGSTPVNTLTGFSCTPNALVGPGLVQCTVTLEYPTGSTGAQVPIIPFPINIPGSPFVLLPANVSVQPGQNSGIFVIFIPEVPAASETAIEAAYNGGTRVATVQLTPGVPRINGVAGALALANSSPLVIGVNVQITNGGTGVADALTLTTITAKTLAGTGTVTYLGQTYPGGSAALPINLGTLQVGSLFTETIELFFSVPSTVARFSVTETGTVQDLRGNSYQWSTGQTVFPSQAK